MITSIGIVLLVILALLVFELEYARYPAIGYQDETGWNFGTK